MGVPEPEHLVGVAKTCPRPGCGSSRVKWRYYNNNLDSQPRYWCMACEKHFTYGGKIRLSKQEKEDAAASAKQLRAEMKAARDHAKLQKSSLEINNGASNEMADDHQLVAVDQPRRSCKRRLIEPATIGEGTKSTGPRIRLRVTGGGVIKLYKSSSKAVEMEQAGADASMQGEAAGHDDSGPLVPSEASGDETLIPCVGSSTVSGLPDDIVASEPGYSEYSEQVDSEEYVITGHASMRSWECLFS